ncbi:MAG: protein TolR [Deltaproteobacteria bacterium RIFOXYA12_FULL_58_15]|nr:MAG: protein TolR [Deltaproteobacteria bacterium RIFOXYA12_FULL_58_15]OGR13159.1 MAG: protein TolR [Deltaproteobacteria bacterium RIFOXYB12_FULL_58_9]
MAMQTNGSGRAMSEINVTPMVDVMLVLLVIFMVTAPLIQQGVKVDLPETKAAALDSKEDRIILTVTAEKKIYISNASIKGATEIPYAQLRDKLVGNAKLEQDKEIYLHADRNLDYGFVVDIMAIVKDAGVENMGMVTNPSVSRPQ